MLCCPDIQNPVTDGRSGQASLSHFADRWRLELRTHIDDVEITGFGDQIELAVGRNG